MTRLVRGGTRMHPPRIGVLASTGSYETTLVVKLVVVVVSGVTAALHARASGPAARAVFGALTGVSALAALFPGVLLAG